MKGMQITFKRIDAEVVLLYSKNKNHVCQIILHIMKTVQLEMVVITNKSTRPSFAIL